MLIGSHPKGFNFIVHANERIYSSRHGNNELRVTSVICDPYTNKESVFSTVSVYYNGRNVIYGSIDYCWMSGRIFPDDVHLFILD